MSQHPNIDRVRATRDESAAIGGFLEWLLEQGIHLMKRGTVTYDDPCPGCGGLGHGLQLMPVFGTDHREWRDGPCERCRGVGSTERQREGWVDQFRGIEDLLAQYHAIDLQELERERLALLDDIRAGVDLNA